MSVDGPHPLHWVEPASLAFADIGDLSIALGIFVGLKVIEEQAAPIAHLVTIGGEHTITLPLLRALAGRRVRWGSFISMHTSIPGPTTLGRNTRTVPSFITPSTRAFLTLARDTTVDTAHHATRGLRLDYSTRGDEFSAQDVHEIGTPAVAERVRAVVTEGPLYLSLNHAASSIPRSHLTRVRRDSEGLRVGKRRRSSAA